MITKEQAIEAKRIIKECCKEAKGCKDCWLGYLDDAGFYQHYICGIVDSTVTPSEWELEAR